MDRWLRRISLRLRSIVLGTRVDHELDEEMQFHIEQQTELNICRGMAPDEARRSAMCAFGGVEQKKEECRDTRRVSWLLDAVRDGRHALRVLARSPGFAIAAVMSLGIGIGANVVMFAVVDALLLKKLRVPIPDGLVQFVTVMEPPYRSDSVGFPTFERLQQSSHPFSHMAAMWPIERANLTVDGAANAGSNLMTRVVLVSGDYFATLGIDAVVGRTLAPADQAERPIAVVSDTFWKTRLDSDSGVLSRRLHLNGVTFEIVGVMPPGFFGETVGLPADLWVSFAHASRVMPEVPQGTRGFIARVIGRVRPGVTVTQAASAMQVIYKRVYRELLAERGIKIDEAEVAKGFIELIDASRGISPQRQSFRQSMLILMAAVVLLLLVACANVANLLLARSAARQRELAVRLAVGAGRGRIARQMLTESALLASLGGIAGLAIGLWTTRLVSALLAAAPVSMLGQSSGLTLDLRLDPRVLLFATASCAVATMVSGVAPAVAAQRVTPASTLRSSHTLGLGRLAGPSSILLIAQVAISLVLLIGAGLFVATLRNLRAQDLGIDREHELFVWTVPGQTGAHDEAMVQLWHRMIERLSTIPGVVAVGASNQAVLSGGDATANGIPAVLMTVVGEAPKPTPLGAGRAFVTPGFFDATGIRLIAGRDFTEQDTAATTPVTILNASMARFYFGSEAAAVGRMVMVPGQVKQPHQVVGVVRDFVRSTPRHELNTFSNFFPYGHQEAINRGQQSRLRVMLIAIRTAGDPLAIAESVRREIRTIDPLLPILRINTTEQQLDDVLAQDRLMASLSSALGGAAMVLASLGLFGLLSYRVARRTNEIGVRVAFGATRGAVLRLVLTESSRLVAAGLAAGLAAAILMSRFAASRLFGVSATDPLTIAGATALLTVVAAIAAIIPARQAATVDPSVALRSD